MAKSAAMQWREQTDDADFIVPDEVADLSFRIRCTSLPTDHSWALYRALCEVLPWLADEKQAAVHRIFDAASGNGWLRSDDDFMQLSRRTRLYLRLPKSRFDDAFALCGRTLNVGGFSLTVGDAKVRALTAWHTLFARSVVCESDDEETFSRAVSDSLAAINIRPPKMLCGIRHSFCNAESGAEIYARSVLLADLELEESIRLQQTGLGENRLLGCGIFLPHKSIGAVR